MSEELPPLIMPLDEFIDRLETIEGMEDPFTSICRCYAGEKPIIRLYHGEKPVGISIGPKDAKSDPELMRLLNDGEMVHFYDVGYCMLRTIRQEGSPLSVQEANQLGEGRFGTAYHYIEQAIERLAKVGAAKEEGEYIGENSRYTRFGLGDLTQFFVSYRPPINQDNPFMKVAAPVLAQYERLTR